MIQYGIACLLVCLLALPDKRVMPFALTISAGWVSAAILGKLSPDHAWMAWPFISAVSGVILYRLSQRYRFWWAMPVAALAGAMLMLDGLYVVCRYLGVQIEVEYSRALDLALIAQLSLIGYGGLVSDGGFLAWMRSRLRRGDRVVYARSRAEDSG